MSVFTCVSVHRCVYSCNICLFRVSEFYAKVPSIAYSSSATAPERRWTHTLHFRPLFKPGWKIYNLYFQSIFCTELILNIWLINCCLWILLIPLLFCSLFYLFPHRSAFTCGWVKAHLFHRLHLLNIKGSVTRSEESTVCPLPHTLPPATVHHQFCSQTKVAIPLFGVAGPRTMGARHAVGHLHKHTLALGPN